MKRDRAEAAEHDRLLAELPSRWTLVEPTGDGRFRARARLRGSTAADAVRHEFAYGRTAAELLEAIAAVDGCRRPRPVHPCLELELERLAFDG